MQEKLGESDSIFYSNSLNCLCFGVILEKSQIGDILQVQLNTLLYVTDLKFTHLALSNQKLRNRNGNESNC